MIDVNLDKRYVDVAWLLNLQVRWNDEPSEMPGTSWLGILRWLAIAPTHTRYTTRAAAAHNSLFRESTSSPSRTEAEWLKAMWELLVIYFIDFSAVITCRLMEKYKVIWRFGSLILISFWFMPMCCISAIPLWYWNRFFNWGITLGRRICHF